MFIRQSWAVLLKLPDISSHQSTLLNRAIQHLIYYPWSPILSSSDEGLKLEKSAFKSIYGGQITLSTQLIKPNYLVILLADAGPQFLKKLILFIYRVVRGQFQYITELCSWRGGQGEWFIRHQFDVFILIYQTTRFITTCFNRLTSPDHVLALQHVP